MTKTTCVYCKQEFVQEEGKPTEFCSRNCTEGYFHDSVGQELREMGLPVDRRTR